MDALLDEAVRAPEPFRGLSRLLLQLFAQIGLDVTQPILADSDIQRPDYGSMGLHLAGFPECLAKAPYEEQAHRLFARCAELRRRIQPRDDRWYAALAAAGARFLNEGELPDDELLREAVLANGELFALARNFGGDGDAEVLAAFDAAAASTGEQRDDALRRLQELHRRDAACGGSDLVQTTVKAIETNDRTISGASTNRGARSGHGTRPAPRQQPLRSSPS
ncbi:MAG TPA: hypothetical protein VFZ65_01440 [Planctomycetota bacterium]|nr:hypothetical protein [Planctomycetota bacterium]